MPHLWEVSPKLSVQIESSRLLLEKDLVETDGKRPKRTRLFEHELHGAFAHARVLHVEVIIQRNESSREKDRVAKLEIVEGFSPRVTSVDMAKGKRAAKVSRRQLSGWLRQDPHEVRFAKKRLHVLLEHGPIPRPGAGNVLFLVLFEKIDGVESFSSPAKRGNTDRRKAMMNAYLEHIPQGAMSGEELIVGHKHQCRIVRKPAFDPLKRYQVGQEETLLHLAT